MACEQPKSCNECPGCKKSSDEHEAQLDKVQNLIEDELARELKDVTDSEQRLDISAGIVNELERAGWLNLGEI